MILNTDILIWYFRGDQKASEFISSVPSYERRVSSVCVMELVQGCRNRQEMRMVKAFLQRNIAAIVPPDERISERAILLLERHAAADGLKTIDALVAATALQEDDSLATSNHKHFKKISGLEVHAFQP